MNSREEKIKADKFALIYEFNNNSPLFSRVASKHLEKGELDLAIPILENGLKKYPVYQTAIIIYSLALAMAGDKDSAKKILSRLNDSYGFEETIKYYSEKIENIPVDDPITSLSELNDPFDGANTNKEIPEDHGEAGVNEKIEKTDDDLDELAEKLKNASMPVINDKTTGDTNLPSEDDSDQMSGKSLVSETLAKIYFNQGNFKEALSIYETLIEIQPHKKEHYQKLIDQIEEQIKNQ